MKRISLIITILFCFCSVAYTGQITDELDQVQESKWQSERAIEGWSKLEYAHRVLQEVDVAVQEVVDQDGLDLIPTKTKLALNRAWQIYKQALAEIQTDPEIMEAFEWRPTR